MIDGIDMGSVITSVPVIGVLIAWLQSVRSQNKELHEKIEQLNNEVKSALIASKRD